MLTLFCTGVRHMGHSCASCLRSASLHLLHSTVCLQGSSCTEGGASQHTWVRLAGEGGGIGEEATAST
jgi:hypothetical protein